MNESRTARVTIEEAARLLGIEKQSVKKRIQRGKLRSEKGPNGNFYVYVDRSETVGDGFEDKSATDRSELVDVLREQVAYLRDVVATRDEEIRRRDVIISQLTSRIPEIEAPSAPAQTQAPAEAHQEAAEQPAEDGVRVVGSPPGDGKPPNPPERASWWRRFFGFE